LSKFSLFSTLKLLTDTFTVNQLHISDVTKALDAETEAKTEAAGFETEAEAEAAGFETEAEAEAVAPETKTEAKAVASEICEIPRNCLKIQTYRVPSHPRSLILVSIESAYATSC